jgi:protein-tyrosine phosphatase
MPPVVASTDRRGDKVPAQRSSASRRRGRQRSETMMLKHFALALVFGLAAALPVRGEEPRKIAFVDTGNTGRSVSAEALANVLIGKGGLHAAVISRAVDMDPFDVHPEANVVILLRERGIDVSSHIAAQLTANDVRHADLVLTMTTKHKAKVLESFPEARDKTFVLADYATGEAVDVPDAWGKPMEVYQAMLHQLDQYVPAALAKATTAKP